MQNKKWCFFFKSSVGMLFKCQNYSPMLYICVSRINIETKKGKYNKKTTRKIPISVKTLVEIKGSFSICCILIPVIFRNVQR
jgi:hypothetical protein